MTVMEKTIVQGIFKKAGYQLGKMRLTLMVTLIGVLSACGGGSDESNAPAESLVILKQAQTSKTPAVVTVSFKVEHQDGRALAGLSIDDIVLEENGVAISASESSRQVIPDPGEFTYSTLLLLDFSGSVINSGLEELILAANTFVEKVIPPAAENDGVQELAIAIFDGSEEIKHITSDFLSDQESLNAALALLNSSATTDNSTNLYGAVTQGVDHLEAKLTSNSATDAELLVAGSIVLFTDGTDQANRVDRSTAQAAVDDVNPNISVFTIGLQGETDDTVLRDLGVDGFEEAGNLTTLVSSFEEVAQLISDEANSFYILDYCSPKRNGSDNELTIRVNHEGGTGALAMNFSAIGFSGICNEDSL